MITLAALQIVWYVLLLFLLAMFVVLDGYDLGTGIWYLLARRGQERTQLLTAIAPFWDGNQVWLVTAGGATFAAFPPLYAALLSGLYPLLIILLLALILRTVSVEYAQKEHRARPRQVWDVIFGVSSTAAVVSLGLLLGNVLAGLPLDADGELRFAFGAVFSPMALLVTILLFLAVTLHGAIWIRLKTTGEVRRRARRWGRDTWIITFPLLIAAFAVLACNSPRLVANYVGMPALWAVPMLALLAVAVAGAAHLGERDAVAFAASSVSILLLFGSSAVALYPTLLPAQDPTLSLTAYNASASHLALTAMLISAILGLPVVIAYSAGVHWLFRERARPEAGSEYSNEA
ncbi:MAG: cytochrome d ubiquinol oxidase subunit II [Armatimonadia bacterium]